MARDLPRRFDERAEGQVRAYTHEVAERWGIELEAGEPEKEAATA